MSLSFYDCSVASFLQTLGGVKNAMERGAATAADSALDLEALVNFRLHEDMLPFSFQVVSVWHHSLGAMKGLSAGLFEPPPKLGELSYSDLLGLVDDAIAYCAELEETAVNELGGRPMLFKIGKTELPFTTESFLLSFSLPNFYFHATTTYSILRHHGVPLGKMDYLGSLRMAS